MMLGEHRLLSRPVNLDWAGWRTDTYRMQQAGWSISAHEDIASQSMGLAFNNERLGMRGISATIGWEYMKASYGFDAPLPTLPVRLMGNKIHVHELGTGIMPSYKPIDAMPQMIERKITCLEDYAHFAPAHTRTQQLIVPAETVDDLMARIMDMQHGPRIERIKNEIAEGDRTSFTHKQNFHAQIISLAA